MALQLKQNSTYPDPYNDDLTTAYANIKYSGGWNALEHLISFDIFVYKSATDRENGRLPIKNERFLISGDDYLAYFEVAISTFDCITSMTVEQVLARIAYEYLLNKQVDDLPLVVGTINMADWEGDE